MQIDRQRALEVLKSAADMSMDVPTEEWMATLQVAIEAIGREKDLLESLDAFNAIWSDYIGVARDDQYQAIQRRLAGDVKGWDTKPACSGPGEVSPVDWRRLAGEGEGSNV